MIILYMVLVMHISVVLNSGDISSTWLSYESWNVRGFRELKKMRITISYYLYKYWIACVLLLVNFFACRYEIGNTD